MDEELRDILHDLSVSCFACAAMEKLGWCDSEVEKKCKTFRQAITSIKKVYKKKGRQTNEKS